MMRAVRVASFGGPNVLKCCSDVALPKPNSDEILIKVKAIGVNPVDTYIRSGNYAVLPSCPFTPGMDCSGDVVEAGMDAAKKFRDGDRVYTYRTSSGAYAEFATIPANNAFHLPKHVSYKEGAAIGTAYFTAYKALVQRGGARPGETVLIHGASGGVGVAACQIALALGMTVVGTVGSAPGGTMLRQLGVDAVFSHKAAGYVQEMMKFTGNRGYDIILEMLANVNLNSDLELIAFKGRIMVIGNRGNIEINPRLAMKKEADIRGLILPSSSIQEIAEMAAALGAGMKHGWVKPVIQQEHSLDEADKAHEEVIAHSSGSAGKIILTV